jgi:hypothetical protein
LNLDESNCGRRDGFRGGAVFGSRKWAGTPNGTTYMAQESLREVVRLDREDRAEVHAIAARFVRADVDEELGLTGEHPVASIRSIASAHHEPRPSDGDGQPLP